MGLLDTLLGRSKPVKANLDALFALPGAAVTLQVTTGLVPGPQAGVCFKPPAGHPFDELQAEVEQLLRTGEPPAGAPGTGAASGADIGVHHSVDRFGYRWIVVDGATIEDLVTRVHMVHSSLEDAGWATQLLCSVFRFRPDTADGAAPSVTGPVYFVYLAKRGTFYPFAPLGDERRDNELELRLRSVVGSDLPIEEDLGRWFPLWDLPLS